MKKYKRYRFVDWNGLPKGVIPTDSLLDAIQSATESECEVIDTQTPTGNQVVFSTWEGWNIDYDFYNKDIADFIMLEIKNKEEKIVSEKKDGQFTCDELRMLSEATLSTIDNITKAKALIHNLVAQNILSGDMEKYRDLNYKVCEIWRKMPDYKE